MSSNEGGERVGQESIFDTAPRLQLAAAAGEENIAKSENQCNLFGLNWLL